MTKDIVGGVIVAFFVSSLFAAPIVAMCECAFDHGATATGVSLAVLAVSSVCVSWFATFEAFKE